MWKLETLWSISRCVMAAVPLVIGCADIESAETESEPIAQTEDPLYVASTKIWPSLNIPVCWETAGTFPTERVWVQDAVMKTWQFYSRLNFTGWGTCTPTSSGIRLGIADVGPHAKALGSGLNGVYNGVVMNFTFQTWSPSCQSTKEYCIRAIAVHEFGHALGFAHEQNRPDTPSWCDQEQGSNGDTLVGPWDLDSVMNYCNPDWNGDGELSAGDVAGLQSFYGTPGGVPDYYEAWGYSPLLSGWLDNGDQQRVGDFRGLGRDQIMYVNRGGADGKIMIVDYQGSAPGQVPYFEAWGGSALLDGWLDDNDLQLVGDFRGLGHDQVMYVNRGGSGGKVMIVDYSGAAPGSVLYFEAWGGSPLLNGWLDGGDAQIVGDFRGLGRDQVMYVNRGGAGGKIMIVDYSGAAPGAVHYWEDWGSSALLSGWLDDGDLRFAGDFRGLGRDQLLYVNRQYGGGKVMIVDYLAAAPGAVQYWEDWGASPLLNGWIDDGDWQIAGDFRGLGRDQMMFFNAQGTYGKFLIVDYQGAVPGSVPFVEQWGQSALLNGWLDAGDLRLKGTFRNANHEQLMFINRQPGGGKLMSVHYNQ